MSELQWFVDYFTYFRERVRIGGWAFHQVQSIREMGMVLPGEEYVKLSGYGLKSTDVEVDHGPPAHECRFQIDVPVSGWSEVANLKLIFTLTDGRTIEISDLSIPKLAKDPFHQLRRRFFSMLAERNQGRLLQLGFPNPSLAPNGMEHVAVDSQLREHVDVVADPHALSSVFAAGHFDAVLSIAAFEHFLMPWKVVLELNHVLKPGGLVLISSHLTSPLHDEPTDSWRFSERAWQGLFNTATGFKILGTALGEPASVVPELFYRARKDVSTRRAFLGSAVLCEKTSTTTLRWDVDSRTG